MLRMKKTYYIKDPVNTFFNARPFHTKNWDLLLQLHSYNIIHITQNLQQKDGRISISKLNYIYTKAIFHILRTIFFLICFIFSRVPHSTTRFSKMYDHFQPWLDTMWIWILKCKPKDSDRCASQKESI